MIWLNKTVKVMGYIGVRIITALALFLLALLVSSPILCVVVCGVDALRDIPPEVQGKLWLVWLGLAVPFFIGFYIYTEVKAQKTRKSAMRLKQKQNNGK